MQGIWCEIWREIYIFVEKSRIMSTEERIKHLEQRMNYLERKQFTQSVTISIVSITVFFMAIKGILI